MYTTVLSYSLCGKFDYNESIRLRDLFCCIISSIVVLFDAMSLANLAIMLNELKAKIISTLNCLHLVLDVPKQEDKLIRVLHLSFYDFLLDLERCLNHMFSIDAKAAHYYVFNCCLRIMLIHLQRNVCNLQQLGTRASEISKSDIDKNIPLPV